MLAATLAGSLLGFLRYNFQPARIYLGDTGSLFIGLNLGALSMIGDIGQVFQSYLRGLVITILLYTVLMGLVLGVVGAPRAKLVPTGGAHQARQETKGGIGDEREREPGRQ